MCNLLLRFGNGRFESSTPISLLWHSSPLNRIDYWFCSLRLLWDFPSDSQCSKRCAEEKQKSLCALSHNDIHMGRVTWNTLSLQQYASQEAEGCHGANAEIKSKPLMWHIDLIESRVIAKCTCCFCIDLASQKKTRWTRLIINRRGNERKLLVHHQTWILSNDITSPGAHHKTVHLALLSTRSRIDLLLIFDCTPVLVTEYFCHPNP